MASILNDPIIDVVKRSLNHGQLDNRNKKTDRILSTINNPSIAQVTEPQKTQATVTQPKAQPSIPKLISAHENNQMNVNMKPQRKGILLTNKMGNSAGEVVGNVEEFKRGLRDNYSKPRSNIDVSFDGSVDANARQRFLQNPVRPSAQIARGPRGSQLSGQVKNGVPIEFAEKEPALKLLTRENTPGMGWQARLKLNEQMLQNHQSNIESLRANSQKNQLNELEQYTLDTQKSLVNLQDRFAKATPEERQQMMPEMIARGIFKDQKAEKPDVRTIDEFGPAGEKIGQRIIRDDGSGNYVDVTPKQTEHPAISYLRNNDTPENRAAFKKKFGRLPDDFQE